MKLWRQVLKFFSDSVAALRDDEPGEPWTTTQQRWLDYLSSPSPTPTRTASRRR
jgi:hypothetical protein